MRFYNTRSGLSCFWNLQLIPYDRNRSQVELVSPWLARWMELTTGQTMPGPGNGQARLNQYCAKVSHTGTGGVSGASPL